jgi:hypothetical protein
MSNGQTQSEALSECEVLSETKKCSDVPPFKDIIHELAVIEREFQVEFIHSAWLLNRGFNIHYNALH